MALAQLRLDALWDFSDVIASELRLADAIAASNSPDEAEELRTQLARARALQGDFVGADAILDAIEARDSVIAARIDLERGRVRKLAGAPADAIPPFLAALESARTADDLFLEVDILHLLALVDRPKASEWVRRGLEVLEDVQDPRTLRWSFALHRIHGEWLAAQQDLASAVRAFELAERAADDFGTEQQRVLIAGLLDQARAALEAEQIPER